MDNEYRYKRILLKISGEALKGASTTGYSADAISEVVERVKNVVDCGVEVALVIGAGNIWRGVNGAGRGMDSVTADYMGMLATVMNALCVKDAFDAAGISAVVQTSIPMEPIAPRYNRAEAIAALESGKVVIFAGGTGSPFFTTDTTAALRALETGCDVVLKATKVDGIYSADPKKYPSALRFETITYEEALSRQLKIMDSTAFSMCSDHDLPIIVFNFSDPDALDLVMRGDTSIATVVSNQE
jgi:uridylate kinase